MHFLRRHLELLIICMITIIMLIANFWHVIAFWFSKPPDTVFIGITHYYEDYFYYLSTVQQGMQGGWLTENLYTTENVTPAPLWTVNLLIGKVGALINVPSFMTYNTAVILAAVTWLATIYIIIKRLVPDHALLRIAGFLIAVTASPYYLLQSRSTGELFVNPYLYFYNYTSAFNRIGGVFHLIFQNILSVWAIVIAADIIRKIHTGTFTQNDFLKKTVIMSVLLTALMFINPSYVLVDVAAIAAVACGFFIIKPDFLSLRRYLFLVLLAGSMLGISFLVLAGSFTDPFYRYFREFENTVQPTIPDIFFHSMGVILILVAIGLVPYFSKKDPLRILGAVYAILPIIIYFSDIPRILGIPYFRLHQPPAYIFFGVAAAEGLWLLSFALSKIFSVTVTKLIKASPPIKAFRLSSIFTGIFTAVFILFHLPMLKYEIDDRMSSYWLPSWLNSMDRGTYDGLMSLNREPKTKNALAFNNLEILVPALTGQRVYVGHKSLTYDYGRKIAEAYRFYYGQMSADEARRFLTDNNIGYILWHKQDGKEQLQMNYPFFEKKFDNEALTIYRYSY